MIVMKEEEIKDHLISLDREFRHLVEEHHLYEGKLNDLLNRHPWTEQDHLSEVKFKKRKLQLKDQMSSKIQKFRNELSQQAT